MQKRKLSLIMLVAASLVMCMVLVGGVLYAWLLSNEEVTGGIRVRVSDLNDSGVDITSFNDGNIPDDGTLIFPGEKLKLGLRVTQMITNFQVGFTIAKLTNDAFYEKFNDRPDLVYGMYKQEKNITGQTAPVEYDYDLEAALDGYVESIIDDEFEPEGEEGYTAEQLAAMRARREELRQAARVEFLKRFTDATQNHLARTFTVKLLSIMPWDGWNSGSDYVRVRDGSEDFFTDEEEDFDYELMFTPPVAYGVNMNMFSLPQWVRVYEDVKAGDPPQETGIYQKLAADEYNYVSLDRSSNDPNYDAVKDEIRRTENGAEYVKIEWQRFSINTRIDIEIGYGIQAGFGHAVKPGYGAGSAYRPSVDIRSSDELVTKYGMESGRYYAHNYNCFSYQNALLGFSTAQVG